MSTTKNYPVCPNPAKPEHIQAAVNLAEEMLSRAQLVNKAQYAHGINSTSSRIDYILRSIKRGSSGAYGDLDVLRQYTMQLGGYLYALKEKIEP